MGSRSMHASWQGPMFGKAHRVVGPMVAVAPCDHRHQPLTAQTTVCQQSQQSRICAVIYHCHTHDSARS